jgi:hypothetical protein
VMLSRPLSHHQTLPWRVKQSQTLWKNYYHYIAVLCYDTSENSLVIAYVVKHCPSMNTCCSMNSFNLNTNSSDALMASCSISNTHEILSPFHAPYVYEHRPFSGHYCNSLYECFWSSFTKLNIHHSNSWLECPIFEAFHGYWESNIFNLNTQAEQMQHIVLNVSVSTHKRAYQQAFFQKKTYKYPQSHFLVSNPIYTKPTGYFNTPKQPSTQIQCTTDDNNIDYLTRTWSMKWTFPLAVATSMFLAKNTATRYSKRHHATLPRSIHAHFSTLINSSINLYSDATTYLIHNIHLSSAKRQTQVS